MILCSCSFARELQLACAIKDGWSSTLSNRLVVIAWFVWIPSINILIIRSQSVFVVLKIFCWNINYACFRDICIAYTVRGLTFKIYTFEIGTFVEAPIPQRSNRWRNRDGSQATTKLEAIIPQRSDRWRKSDGSQATTIIEALSSQRSNRWRNCNGS